MDSWQAREILSNYRPGDTNSADPRMAKALELAREDPQLAIWFGQHCASQIKLPAEPEVATTVAPAIEKPAGPASAADVEHIIPLSKPALFMIGVTLLIVMAGILWSSLVAGPQNHFANYRDRMARLVQRSYPMKIMLTDQSQIREYFRTNGGPFTFALPRNLEKLPGKGAAVFTWHSQPVYLFGMEAGGNTNLYLFLIKESAFANPPVSNHPQFSRVGQLMTASWAPGDGLIYLLTGPNDEATLQNFLDTQ